MLTNDQGLQATIARISRFWEQVAHLRNADPNPANYHASAGGFLAEIDRMNLEVREYLRTHPAEAA